MTRIADIRRMYPEATASLTDLDITDRIAEKMGVHPYLLAQDIGAVLPKQEFGAIDSFQRGMGMGLAGTGSALRDKWSGETIGGIASWLEQQGRGIMQRNPDKYDTTEKFLGSPLSAFGHGVAEAAGQAVPAIAVGLATRSPSLALGAMGGSSLLQNTGETRTRQREKGMNSDEDIAAAWGTGVAQAVPDVFLGPEAKFAKLFAKGGAKGLTEQAAREIADQGLLKYLATSALKAGGWEGGTEVYQSALGRAAADDPLSGADANEEYGISFLKGASGGVGLSGIGAPLQRRGASKFVGQIDDARATMGGPINSLEDLRNVGAASKFLESVAGNDFGLQAAEAIAAQSAAKRNTANDAVLRDIADTAYAGELGKAYSDQSTKVLEDLRSRWEEMQQRISDTPATVPDVPALDWDALFAEYPADPQLSLPGFEPTAVPTMPKSEPIASQPPSEPIASQLASDIDAMDTNALFGEYFADTQPQPVSVMQAALESLINGRAGPSAGFGTQANPQQMELFSTPKRADVVAAPTKEANEASAAVAAVYSAADTALAAGKITPDMHTEVLNYVDSGNRPNPTGARKLLHTYVNRQIVAQPEGGANGLQVEGQTPAQEVGATNVPAKVDAKSNQGRGVVEAGSDGNAPAVQGVNGRPGADAGALASRVPATAPVGDATVQPDAAVGKDAVPVTPKRYMDIAGGAEFVPTSALSGLAQGVDGGLATATIRKKFVAAVRKAIPDPVAATTTLDQFNAIISNAPDEAAKRAAIRKYAMDVQEAQNNARQTTETTVPVVQEKTRETNPVPVVEADATPVAEPAVTEELTNSGTNITDTTSQPAATEATAEPAAATEPARTQNMSQRVIEALDAVADTPESRARVAADLLEELRTAPQVATSVKRQATKYAGSLDPKTGVRADGSATQESNAQYQDGGVDYAEGMRKRVNAAIDWLRVEAEQRRFDDAEALASDKAASAAPVRRSQTRPPTPEYRTTTQKIKAALRSWFVSPEQAASRLTVVQHWEDLPQAIRDRVVDADPAKDASDTQAFVLAGKAYMVADNISSGHELGVFLHELGSHIGLDGQEAKIMERVNLWSTQPETTLERRVYDAMQRRMDDANETSQSEQVAYAIEEAVNAGVIPNAVMAGMKLSSVKTVQDLVNWFAQYFKSAVDAMFKANTRGFNAQHLVDLAYGAAREATQGQPAPDVDTTDGVDRPVQFSKAPSASMPADYRKFVGDAGVQLWDELAHLARTAALNLTQVPTLVHRYEERIPQLRTLWNAMQDASNRRGELDLELDGISRMIDTAGMDQERYRVVQEFLRDSTVEQKWGYSPEHFTTKDGKAVKVSAEVDPEFAKRFDNLEPAERAIVKAIFKHGHDMRQLKRSVFSSLGVKLPLDRFGEMEGPYAPLRRFGGFLVEVKSPVLVAAEKADDQKRVDKLKSEEAHYSYEFLPTSGTAKRRYNELMATGKFSEADSYVGPRPEHGYRATELTRASLSKILEVVRRDDSLSADTRTEMVDTITHIYHTTVEDNLARASMQQRKNRVGAHENMFESFMRQGRAEAAFVARMEFSQRVNEAAAALDSNKETKAKEQGLVDVVNLLQAHRRAMLEYKETPIQDAAVSTASVWQLMTNVGYHLTNATQTFTKAIPVMYAEFGNYADTWSAVLNHGFSVWKSVNSTDTTFDSITDKGLRGALRLAVKRQLLDVGMADDLTQWDSFRTGSAAADAALSKGRRVVHLLRQVSRQVERMNRIVTTVAAYSLARQNGRAEVDAQEFAARVLVDAQGDFTHMSAPMVIKRLPKVMTQYRKYQLMVAGLYVRATHDALKGESVETKAVARRLLGSLLAHSAVVGGALGLPLVQNLVMPVMMHIFGDEDDPDDFEQVVRTWFGDSTDVADLVLRGVPTLFGLELSAKLGDAGAFSILPPGTDIPTDKASLLQAVGGLAGPAVGLAGKALEGLSMMADGNVGKGFEKLMPSGVENALRAYRVANEGYTLKNGDVLVSANEIAGFPSLLAGLGVPTSHMRNYQWLQSQQIEIAEFYRNKESALKRKYVAAYDDNDFAAQAELEDAWLKLQDAKVPLRRYFNDDEDALRSHPLKPLLDAPKRRDKRAEDRQSRFRESV